MFHIHLHISYSWYFPSFFFTFGFDFDFRFSSFPDSHSVILVSSRLLRAIHKTLPPFYANRNRVPIITFSITCSRKVQQSLLKRACPFLSTIFPIFEKRTSVCCLLCNLSNSTFKDKHKVTISFFTRSPYNSSNFIGKSQILSSIFYYVFFRFYF